VRDEVAVNGVWKRRDEASIRNEIGRQYACSENIDIQVGRVIKRLGEMGQLNNTYIIYTSDHGMSIGRHGLMGKQNLYQHTWRVPFIVAGPGIQPGTRVTGNIYQSFRPVLEGRQGEMRDLIYGAYSGGGKPGMRCVKQGDWKLIEYEAPEKNTRETQLFNLAENPHELPGQNLAKTPQHTATLAKMKELLLTEMRRLEDPYRFSDQPADNLPEIPQSPPRPRKKAKAKEAN
jgi:choline-sulfatase